MGCSCSGRARKTLAVPPPPPPPSPRSWRKTLALPPPPPRSAPVPVPPPPPPPPPRSTGVPVPPSPPRSVPVPPPPPPTPPPSPPRSAATPVTPPPPPPPPGCSCGPALAPTMQTTNPTTAMATDAAVKADAEAVTKAGDKYPSTVLYGLISSSDTDASDAFVQRDPVYDTDVDSDSDVCSPMITFTSRKQREQWDGLGSADSKIDSSVGSVTTAHQSLCCDGRHVFKACLILVLFLLVLRFPLALMWTIATYLSACMISLIYIFSPTMFLSTIFYHIPYPVLLAIAADRFVVHCAGFLVIHMATGWLAGLLGYAYAKHPQNIFLEKIGWEKIAKHISEEDKSSLNRGHAAAVFGFVTLLLAIAEAVLVSLNDELPIFVAYASFLEVVALFIWVAFVARFMLHDALLSDVMLGYIVGCYICPYLVVNFVILLVVTCFGFTGTIPAIFLWFLMLIIAGLLGYELSVHAQCKQMMVSR